jgi:hypothetical protein
VRGHYSELILEAEGDLDYGNRIFDIVYAKHGLRHRFASFFPNVQKFK